MHVYLHDDIYVCMYVCVYMHIRIRTYIHTCIHAYHTGESAPRNAGILCNNQIVAAVAGGESTATRLFLVSLQGAFDVWEVCMYVCM